MQLVLQLAQRDEEQIKQQVSQLNQALLSLQEQIQSLQEYTQEYANNFANKGGVKSVMQITQERGFLQQMSEAIGTQKQQEDGIQKQLDVYQQKWMESHLKCKNLQGLVEKYQKEEQQVRDKAEQKNIDELSLSKFRRSQF